MNKRLENLYKQLEGAQGIAREILEQNIAELEAELERRQQANKSDNQHQPRVYAGKLFSKKDVLIDK